MNKVISISQIQKTISSLKNNGKVIVLVGGCFDILHIGHIKFLRAAKKMGDVLMVMLESDKQVTYLKGKNRPFFKQKERAYVLSTLSTVDYVILLPPLMTDKDYEKIVWQIRPDVITVTANDTILHKKKYQAKIVGGRIEIVPYIKTYSSSKLASIIGIE